MWPLTFKFSDPLSSCRAEVLVCSSPSVYLDLLKRPQKSSGHLYVLVYPVEKNTDHLENKPRCRSQSWSHHDFSLACDFKTKALTTFPQHLTWFPMTPATTKSCSCQLQLRGAMIILTVPAGQQTQLLLGHRIQNCSRKETKMVYPLTLIVSCWSVLYHKHNRIIFQCKTSRTQYLSSILSAKGYVEMQRKIFD